jgi:hypothetical protein
MNSSLGLYTLTRTEEQKNRRTEEQKNRRTEEQKNRKLIGDRV